MRGVKNLPVNLNPPPLIWSLEYLFAFVKMRIHVNLRRKFAKVMRIFVKTRILVHCMCFHVSRSRWGNLPKKEPLDPEPTKVALPCWGKAQKGASRFWFRRHGARGPWPVPR